MRRNKRRKLPPPPKPVKRRKKRHPPIEILHRIQRVTTPRPTLFCVQTKKDGRWLTVYDTHNEDAAVLLLANLLGYGAGFAEW